MSGRILAIDPGSTESGWCSIDVDTLRPLAFGKHPNDDVLASARISWPDQHVVIEMVAAYGMPVGAEVFQTCVWIGRYHEALTVAGAAAVDLVTRMTVKMHHCHHSRANDASIKQALIDRFAPGEPNYGKGTKARPGWFYGFATDVWSAYALAVYAADTQETR